MSKIVGLDKLNKSLDKIADTKKIAKSLEMASALVERSAIQKAPKDTGALRRSITSEVKDMRAIIFTPVEYAPYVEYGTGLFAVDGNGRKDGWIYKDDEGKTHFTRGQKPQPFLRPALIENKAKITKILLEGLKK